MAVSANDLLIVAGEASGDLHGARLLAELEDLVPGLEAYGLGGDEMASQRFEPLAHSREIAVVGFIEVLKIVRRARAIFHRILTEVDRRGTRYAVLIDSPGFNLRLAKKLHRRGVRIVYYISPQVWAWRQGRVKQIARYVDRMLVLFPFEVDFYRRHGVEVAHVGHPLIDEVPPLAQVWDDRVDGDVPDRYVVSLLPGSRASEVRSLLPALRAGAELLAERLPLTVQLIEAATVPGALFDEILDGCRLEVRRVRRDRFAAIAGSHLALCASGTATLEVALVGTPMVVIYRVSPWTARLGRLLIRVPYASMVNLVLGRPAVPELLQEQAEPRRIAAEAARLLADRGAIDAMRRSFGELRRRLGAGGASRRAAAEVARRLGYEAGG